MSNTYEDISASISYYDRMANRSRIIGLGYLICGAAFTGLAAYQGAKGNITD